MYAPTELNRRLGWSTRAIKNFLYARGIYVRVPGNKRSLSYDFVAKGYGINKLMNSGRIRPKFTEEGVQYIMSLTQK